LTQQNKTHVLPFTSPQEYGGDRVKAEKAKADLWFQSDDRRALREELMDGSRKEIRSEVNSKRAPIGVKRSKAGAIAKGVMGALGSAVFVFGLAMSMVSSVGEGGGGWGWAFERFGCASSVTAFKPDIYLF
jgi:hypothetical protein